MVGEFDMQDDKKTSLGEKKSLFEDKGLPPIDQSPPTPPVKPLKPPEPPPPEQQQDES